MSTVSRRRQLGAREPHWTEVGGIQVGSQLPPSGSTDFCYLVPATRTLLISHLTRGLGRWAICAGGERHMSARLPDLPTHTHMMWTMTPMPDTASLSTAFSMACEMVSNRCSGSMLGSQRDSHIPYICSVQVPLTTKSSVTMGQPIRSREQMKGLKVFGSNP